MVVGVSSSMVIRGRVISKGLVEGEVLVSTKKISFLGDVDVETGEVIAKDSDIRGKSVVGKILVFPTGRGSTVGTYVLLRMKKRGTSPKAIINVETEPIIAVGAIIAGIPLMDKLDLNPLEVLKNGDRVVVNAYEGFVEVKGRD
jgi:predicted aconitase with swiveling domain